jgi:prepilin-type processing-associated H-X9-DG protein
MAPDSTFKGHSFTRLIHIPDTSRMVWFTDAAVADGDWKDRKDQPNRGSCYFVGHIPGAGHVMPRHGGKINVGFADGHVALLNPTAINWGYNHTDNGKYIGYTNL